MKKKVSIKYNKQYNDWVKEYNNWVKEYTNWAEQANEIVKGAFEARDEMINNIIRRK